MNTRVKVVRRSGIRNLYLRWVCPQTGREKQKSARTTHRREAERAAAKLETELNSGKYSDNPRISWEEFRERYESEKLESLADRTYQSTSTALNHLENEINPRRLGDITAGKLSYFQSALRSKKLSETSIATHLRHIRAALSWAVSVGLLPIVPRIEMPKRVRGSRMMRGRPLTEEEFQAMLDVVPEIRPQDFELWQEYLRGLWLSGLRLSESITLGWDDNAPLQIRLGGSCPTLRILAEGEKGHRDRLLPITPDFAAFLEAIPGDRTGPVFRLFTTEAASSRCRVGRIVQSFGEKAKIRIGHGSKAFASAHDLRRSFGSRWALKVTPLILKTLMRHESIETTMKYYVDVNVEEISQILRTCSAAGPGV